MKYQHKLIKIDAIQWTGHNLREVTDWAKEMHPQAKVTDTETERVVIKWPEDINRPIGAWFGPGEWVTFDTFWGTPQFGTAHLGNRRIETYWEPVENGNK